MDRLFAKHAIYMAETPMDIIRDTMNDIQWDARLLSIKGPKGVGKTTLLKQFLKLNYPPGSRKCLYCSVDSIYFSTHSLLDLADEFVKMGGERLVLDEIHKYEHWSAEIKEIYDLYPRLKVAISGSSLLQARHVAIAMTAVMILVFMIHLFLKNLHILYCLTCKKQKNMIICIKIESYAQEE